MANSNEVKIPYRSNESVWMAAEEFRDSYDLRDQVPLDILLVAERDMGLTIEPIKGLKQTGDIEAVLLSNLTTIVVDEQWFMEERFHLRVRFSVAHEIGHIKLHGPIIKDNAPKSIADVLRQLEEFSISSYKSAEIQANEFAGRLLVPIEYLQNEVTALSEGIEQYIRAYPENLDGLPDYLGTKIAKRFNVTDQVVARRIKFERLLDKYTSKNN